MSKRKSKRADRLTETAIKLLALGIGLLLIPLALGGGPIGAVLNGVVYFGGLSIAAGLVMLWLDTRARLTQTQTHLRGKRPAGERRPGHVSSESPQPAQDGLVDRPTTWGPEVLEAIEWRRLEAVVEALFKQAGFDTQAQSHGTDGGVDIWLFSKNKPEAAASVVQCKHWSSKVGVDKVREFKGVMASHQIDRGQFVGTNGFTPDAEAFARANGINLLDKTRLLALISRREPEDQERLLAIALEGEYWKPTCARCGVKMTRRTAQKSGRGFWGCVRYPACRNTL